MLPKRHTQREIRKLRAQIPEIALSSALSCDLYYLTSCQRGLPKPPKRNGSKGAVRPVFTYIFSI